MSIMESAQQLHALAEQVPHNAVHQVRTELEQLQQQVHAILGDTATSQQVIGQIGAVVNEADTLSAGVEHLRTTIVETATYHQQG